MAKTISGTHCTNHGGMARLSGPECKSQVLAKTEDIAELKEMPQMTV